MTKWQPGLMMPWQPESNESASYLGGVYISIARGCAF